MNIINEVANKAVITTRNIVEHGAVIKYVFYDEDGDWQFFDQASIDAKDAMVVSISQIQQLDPSLALTLPDLALGEGVQRDEMMSEWREL